MVHLQVRDCLEEYYYAFAIIKVCKMTRIKQLK